MPHLVACPDKFKGTISASGVAAAVCRGATRAGWTALGLPLADGGDGTLDALGGANRWDEVTGPAGDPVLVGWRLDGGTAVIESAGASGLVLAGGAVGNDPLTATSRGVGELLGLAVAAGAREILVGVGGVASTDGGRDVLDLAAVAPWSSTLGREVAVTVLCDVRTPFVEAARSFGPQKGATGEQVTLLTGRLASLRDRHPALRAVADRPGSGAGGGLGGALAALGARLVSGAAYVADHLGLDGHLARADLVVTGEGQFDVTSLDGKVVGEVWSRGHAAGRPVWAVVGTAQPTDAPDDLLVTSLVTRCGPKRSMADPAACIEEVVASDLAGAFPPGGPDDGPLRRGDHGVRCLDKEMTDVRLA